MAQRTEIQQLLGGRNAVAADNLAVEITDSLTVLLELNDLRNIKRLFMAFVLTVHDLNAFAVQVKFHPMGPWVTILSAAGDFTSPGGLVVGASGDLTTLAAAATGWLSLDVTGLQALRIRGSSASASGTLCDVYAGGAN